MIVYGNQNLEMVLVWLLVHDPLENLCRHLETMKFDADVCLNVVP